MFSLVYGHIFPFHGVLSCGKFSHKVCYFSTFFPVFDFWHHMAAQKHKLIHNNPTFLIMPKENNLLQGGC